MFRVTVRDHIMVAHSFKGEVFGPAQRLHGATFVVDLELARRELDANGIVVDIGLLGELLKGGAGAAQLPQPRRAAGASPAATARPRCWRGRSASACATGSPPARSAREAAALEAIKVTLGESHVAWASYETKLRVA